MEMLLTHEWFWLTAVFLFGAIIGSFLNVFLYRFHTGKSLSGHSHCLSCGTPLQWYDLFPLLSFLALRAKCRACHSKIPSRYFLVEAATGVMFVFAYLQTDLSWLLPFELLLAVLLVLVVVYDLYHLIIPNEFVLGLLTLALLHQAYLWWLVPDVTQQLLTLSAAAAASGIFAALWYYSKGRWLGFGDVKLLFPLALLVGATNVFSLVVFSFWVGAIISVGMLLYLRYVHRGKERLATSARRLTIKSEIPFAPFLIAGFMLVYYGGYDVLTLIAHVYW